MNKEEHIKHLEALKESISMEFIKYENMLNNINGLINALNGNALEEGNRDWVPIRQITEKAKVVEEITGAKSGKFKFDSNKKIDLQFINALREMGKATKKNEIDLLFTSGKKEYETRHAIRRLRDSGKIVLISIGGSKKYSFWGLSEWVKSNGQIHQEHAPIIDNEQVDAQLLTVHSKDIEIVDAD